MAPPSRELRVPAFATALLTVVLAFMSLTATRALQPEPGPATVSQAPAPTLSEYDKEAVSAVKEFTLNLLFLATGVFALVGGYLASEQKTDLVARNRLLTSLLSFGLSMGVGLFTYMALIYQLADGRFDAFAPALRYLSLAQVLITVVAAVYFYLFLRKNLKRK